MSEATEREGTETPPPAPDHDGAPPTATVAVEGGNEAVAGSTDAGPTDGGSTDGGSTDGGPTTPGRPRRGWVRSELLLALEVLALTSFVYARPVFDAFGDSPETFVARGADWLDVVLFALAIHLILPVVLSGAAAAVGLVGRLAGRDVRRVAHLAIVTGLAGVVVWQLVRPVADWPRPASLSFCALLGAAAAVARWRWEATGRFLRYAGAATVVFLVQFLVLSPTASIVQGGRHAGVDGDVAAAVAAAVGPDGPPVVMVVLDGLSTNLMLDGEGRIDAGLYPNLAGLASDSTWYRNHTTVAQVTLEAVPAILTGSLPGGSTPPPAPVVGEHPDNLFTLLGGSYDVHAGERITGLCPLSLCAEDPGMPVPALLRDAQRIWRQTMTDSLGDPELIPAAFSDRFGLFQRWIDEQDFARGDRPDLFFYHLLLPHAGWEYLPDGRPYAASQPPSGLFLGAWGEWGNDVGRQRHVLQAQASDRLLGALLDRLREAGTYDDALVVVTADHGYAFDEDAPWRGVSEGNVDDILWTPLIVKSPGQTAGRIDDRNVNTTDIVPTIADELGIDMPFDVDGEAAPGADREAGDKWVVDWEFGRLRSQEGDDLIDVDGDESFARVLAADPVEGEGPLAVWQRGEHGDLVGRSVGDLDVGPARPETVDVEHLGQWDRVDAARPPIELVATAPLPVGVPVAVAVDDVVVAVAPTGPTPFGVASLHALLWPEPMHDGDNELALYLVTGDRDAPVLEPLAARAKS